MICADLFRAVRSGNEAAVRVALAAGADVRARNDCALRLAAERGHDGIVRVLLDAGASVSAGLAVDAMHIAPGHRAAVIGALLDFEERFAEGVHDYLAQSVLRSRHADLKPLREHLALAAAMSAPSVESRGLEMP